MNEDDMLVFRDLHIPRVCEKCGKANPEYKGVGEYKCSECGFTMYDDFGVVRNYLEAHAGATQAQVSRETGVAMETIRQFLKEDRLEIAAGSAVMMTCEICNKPIRSGKYCPECERTVARRIEEEKKASGYKKQSMQGYVRSPLTDKGEYRFKGFGKKD